MTSYVGSHNDTEAPIAASNNGVLFLNSAIRYEDIPDGRRRRSFWARSETTAWARAGHPVRGRACATRARESIRRHKR